MSRMRVKFKYNNIPKMTMFAEKLTFLPDKYKCDPNILLGEWIESELRNVESGFNEYARETMRGMMLRTALTVRNLMSGICPEKEVFIFEEQK